MKKALIILALLFLAANICPAENNIMIMVDKIPADFNGEYAIPIGWANDTLIAGFAMSLKISTTGEAIAWLIADTTWVDGNPAYIDGGSAIPGSRYEDVIEQIHVHNSEEITIAGIWLPPHHPGIAPGPLEPQLNIRLHVEGGPGEICLDSVAEIVGGDPAIPTEWIWVWEDVDYYGTQNWVDDTIDFTFNNDGSPHCIDYYEPSYICGDINASFSVNVADAVGIINFAFMGTPYMEPFSNGDTNCDGLVNVSDAVRLINYIFINGNAPCDLDGDKNPDC